MRTDPTSTPGREPLRIGIWCDYGFTLTATAGIGVFVYNLAAGLLELEDEDLEIVMLVRPGDQHLVQDLQRKSRGRLSSIPRPERREPLRPVEPDPPSKPAQISASWLRVTDYCRSLKRAAKWRLRVAGERLRQSARRVLADLRDRVRSQRLFAVVALVLGALLAPLAFFGGWLLYGFYRLCVACMRALFFPQRVLDRIAQSVVSAAGPAHDPHPDSPPELDYDPLALVRAAACDVWLIPYYGIVQQLDFPAVLVIHDLVYLRFPESLPSAVAALREIVPKRASEATLCVCMSAFIRDNDLLGALCLPRDKVRMIRPAAPSDFPEISEEAADELKPPILVRPYLLFPAEFRRYKNQRILVEALHALQNRGEDWLDVVFTGGNGEAPEEIISLIKQYGLQGRVHILGRVDRPTLAALYKRAFATIVPSLYEQGSFPVYEALRWNCPVVCSRIPPLLEQCASMGDAVLYFDPLDPQSLADAVLTLAQDRDGFRHRQSEAARSAWSRTWKDAACEWLAVFREATRLSGVPWSHGVPATVSEPLEAFLFLPIAYQGGVSAFVATALKDLVTVSRERGRLRLTIGIPQDSTCSRFLDLVGDTVAVEQVLLGNASREAVDEVFGRCDSGPVPGEPFSFFEVGAEAARRADAWLALADRFTRPLLPVRPYGVIVYDVIQRHLPEAFERLFIEYWERGILPTLRNASVVVINPEAARDLVDGYGIRPRDIRLLPLTWNCERRFGSCPVEHTDVRGDGFILNVANASVHKGARLLLNSYAHLRSHAGNRVPPLVICGNNTDAFSEDFHRPLDHPYWAEIRRLVRELGLCEGRDVFFLGFVTDPELKDLYQRCSVVVNAAKYDMGSFSLVEAAYFGRPAVSSRYPGVEYLTRRFDIPVSFVPMDDVEALAETLRDAIARPSLDSKRVSEIRGSLARPEFDTRRFAEGLYDLLLAMCERGRLERNRRTQLSTPILSEQSHHPESA